MNLSFNSITSYTNYNKSRDNSGFFKQNVKSNANSSIVASIQSRYAEDKRSERAIKNDKLRDLIRGLTEPANKTNANSHSATLSSKTNGYLDLTSNYEKKAKSVTKYKYNYKEVSSRIRSAKTSVSAGQAVIAAKRKVIEIKRKLSNNSDDNEELQAALIHAERMEMAARKKKHNLELEELVSNTMKRDEASEKNENAINEAASFTEEKISEKEDAIFEEKLEMLSEIVDEVKKQNLEEMSDEMIQELNEMIESFGEDELEELEEMMQLAESMEIVDPHMSEEDFNKLKAKHRASENKAIMKADLDYLKAIIKITVESQAKSTNISPISTGAVGYATPAISAVEASAGNIPALDSGQLEGSSLDLSL